ncbi:hypothetical protein [Magnetospirillum sp. 15-1]|uniref:hypothetical protein n=1 Tax=Magnetospirillum sp. 15-1 TaxID=1979370 RepID=UPI000BBCEE78|nr:hypothetical protein [Magnetospirillum sp. 15-1]
MTDTLPAPTETNIFLGYIDEAEYCRQRGISLRTAQRDRQLRQSPPYTVVGQRVMYRIDSIRTWLLERERQVERKASAPRAGGRK